MSHEQIKRLCNRYYWAAEYCGGRDVLEIACGTGQGLGYLSTISKTFEAGDFDSAILSKARGHYESRIVLKQFDAQELPFEDKTKDVIILFEAIYYIPDANRFVKECARVLRPDGIVLIATANKDLYDFNPSPKSHKYFGTVELEELFNKHGFSVELFGDTPVGEASLFQRVLRPIKKLAVTFNLIPETMGAKKLLKRIVFGKLVKMPAEITSETTEYVPPAQISSAISDKKHKVIYCAATLNPQNT